MMTILFILLFVVGLAWLLHEANKASAKYEQERRTEREHWSNICKTKYNIDPPFCVECGRDPNACGHEPK